MVERSGLTVAAGLWGIAFVALGMAAFTTKADAKGVIGLTSVGQVLTVLALVIDNADHDAPRSLAGRSTTILYLTTFLVVELVGMLLLLFMGERDLSLWFAFGASFSVVGIAVTWRRVPGDNVLACQIFLHAVIVVPLLAALPAFLIDLTRDQGGSGVPLGLTTMSLTVLVLSAVAIPLLIVALLSVLAYNLSRPRPEQDFPWAVLTAHQVLFALIVLRWAGDGL
ncbi:hypothetical protein [Singulisphaera acidiphila]|uniref:Uncharacterized protein n=1 Tax=Singulisphaera acidiphila (strain ATCC BAA-1392 / DSM 18658 / VKM B-2454 / MOB10) TaxID=886293 RepID=L0DBH7_SINAD|nr:hypothetical protein [Singulisphaera acidiphila]AGA26001.1 hypothetical protein Sinac_1622 [Singulisphaera acidiphila DSM 18658]